MIVKMKLVTIIGSISEFDEVVRSCLVDRGFHVENTLSVLSGVKGLYPFEHSNPYEEPLKNALSALSLLNLEPDYRSFDPEKCGKDEVIDYFRRVEEEYTELSGRLEDNRKRIQEGIQIGNQLFHFQDISVDIGSISNATYAKFRFGRLPREVYNTYKRYLEENKHLLFMPTSVEADFVYGMYVTPRRYKETADAMMASLHFERIRISERVQGKAAEAVTFLERERERLEKENEEFQSRINEFLNRERDTLLSNYSYLKFMHDTYDIRKHAARSGDQFYLIGWIGEEDVSELTEQLSRFPNVIYTYDDPEGFVKNLTPPIKLKSFPLFKPFQEFIKIYGLPDYNELDPTPLFALTYPLMFGIMFGDLGQGFVILLCSLLYWKLKKNPIAFTFTISGFFSMIFGFLYGSVFGSEELLPGFHVLENASNTNLELVATVGLGIVLISVAMVMNIINGIKQKNVEKAAFDSHGGAGFIFYWSVIILALILFRKGKAPLMPLYISLLIVLPILLIFAREPVAAFVRKKKWAAKNKKEYFVISFFELFEVLISFLSNTISFIRVGAFAVGHAGMMTVVYTLSEAANGSKNLLVIIIGNLFVMVLEGLIVGIQVLRLEFYELFGKFYAGNGRPLIPFSVQYKIDSDRR